jgi:hypothetical protein
MADYGASSPGSRSLEKKMIKKSSYYEALLRERNAWAALEPEERESFPIGKSRSVTQLAQLLPYWKQVDLLHESTDDLHHRTALLWKALVYANEAMPVPHSLRLPGKKKDMALVDALEKEMLLDINQIEPKLTANTAQTLFGQEHNDDRSPQINAARDVFMALVSHISAAKRILLWIENRKLSWAIVEHGFEPAPFEDMLRYFDDEYPGTHDQLVFVCFLRVNVHLFLCLLDSGDLPGKIHVSLDTAWTDQSNQMQPKPLPEGWGAIRDARTGRFYFIDHKAKTATFLDPRLGKAGETDDVEESDDVEDQPLPEGWEPLRGVSDGRLYFMDHNTKTATYVDPRTGRKTAKSYAFEGGVKIEHADLPAHDFADFPGAPWLVPEVCLAPMENEHAGLTAKIWFHHPTTRRTHAVKLHRVRQGSEELTKLVRSSLRPSLRVFVGTNSEGFERDFVLGKIAFRMPLISHLVDLSSLVDVEAVLSGECDDTPLSDVVERFCADPHQHKKLKVVLDLPENVQHELEEKLRAALFDLPWAHAFAHIGRPLTCRLDSPLRRPRIVIQPHQKALESFSQWHKYRATVTLSLGDMALDDVVKFVLTRVSSVAQMIPWAAIYPPSGSMFDETDVSYVFNKHRGEGRVQVAAEGVAGAGARAGARAGGREAGEEIFSLLTSLI